MVSPVSPVSPTAAEEKGRLQQHYEKLALAAREAEDGHNNQASHGEQTDGVTDEDIYSYELEGSSAPAAGPSQPTGSAPSNRQSINRKSLPPYSGPASSAHAAAIDRQLNRRHSGYNNGSEDSTSRRARYPGLPAIDYHIYSPPLFTLSPDKTMLKSNAPYLSTSVAALATLIRSQATVPPKPQVHITGKRGRKVDFAIKLNLMNLLVPEDQRRQLNYLRCVGTGELAMRGNGSKKPTLLPDPLQFDVTAAPAVGQPGDIKGPLNRTGDALEAWCRLFVEDRAAVKEFILERQVANLDTNWLEGQIRSMVAAIGYKGQLQVTFPITHARVVVQNPDKVHKVVTAMVAFVSGKSTYEVVKSVWPFATHRNGEFDRICAVQSEETWWKEWRDPILYAISQKRSGWVTNEDKLEALMEGVGKGITKVDWGDEYDV